MTSRGPLDGIRVIHLASLGPGPYAAMLLADLGASVTVVDRTIPMQVSVPQNKDPRRRGQQSIALNLKDEDALVVLREMIAGADVLIEGMRPGVTERLGLGPTDCERLNPALIYARVTGWGQEGPLAQTAGHDINYVALSGALAAMGPPDAPPPVPLNLLGDYAGGGAFVVIGILAALQERQVSKRGQIVDGAIVDGVASLTAATMGMMAVGRWGERGTNAFDGSSPWYRCYRTADGKFVAVGAIEPQFYAVLLKTLELDPLDFARDDPKRWPEIADRFAAIFATRDRNHWEKLFEGTDACVSPVLNFSEAAQYPHHLARGTYTVIDGVTQPTPAPRLSRSRLAIPQPPKAEGGGTDEVLREIGRSAEEIARLRARGAVE